MQHSSLRQALTGFKPIVSDVWEYRAELESLARHLCRSPEDSADVTRIGGTTLGLGVASMCDLLHQVTTTETRLLRGRSEPDATAAHLDSLAKGKMPDDSLDPEEMALEMKTRRVVLDRLSALPENYCLALLLKEGKAMSVREIARSMGTSPGSARSVLYRARQAIRGRANI